MNSCGLLCTIHDARNPDNNTTGPDFPRLDYTVTENMGGSVGRSCQKMRSAQVPMFKTELGNEKAKHDHVMMILLLNRYGHKPIYKLGQARSGPH